jgi:hypothetical protein
MWFAPNISALERAGDRQALARALSHARRALREQAIEAMVRLSATAEAEAALWSGATDAAHVLARLPDGEAALLRCLDAPDELARQAALARLPVEPLRRVLATGSPTARALALRRLAAAGEDIRRWADDPQLSGLVRDLGPRPPPPDLPTLITAARAGDAGAVALLADHPEAIDVVRDALRRPATAVMAAMALGRLGDRASLPALQLLLQDCQPPTQPGDPDPRLIIQDAIARLTEADRS